MVKWQAYHLWQMEYYCIIVTRFTKRGLLHVHFQDTILSAIW